MAQDVLGNFKFGAKMTAYHIKFGSEPQNVWQGPELKLETFHSKMGKFWKK